MLAYDKIYFMRCFVISSTLLLVLLASSCSLHKTAVSGSQRPALYAYKHFDQPCISCHGIQTPQLNGAVFTPGFDRSGSCLGCHDYQENHHPIDVVPVDPAGYSLPLDEGKIRCLTCHEIHGGPQKTGTKKLLQGGPYQDRREICFRCHSREAYSLIDPHKMLDKQNRVREVNGKPVCLICHAKTPDPAVDFTESVRFRADVGFLCWRCHPPMPGEFFDLHFLVTPSAKTMNKITTATERRYVILPMVPRGRITCSTCHNPHQEGVIQRPAAAKGAGSKSKLRLPDICAACHDM